MRCRKCGANEWYVRGRYKRCTPCHNRVQLAAYHNRKLGAVKTRKSSHHARPLAEQIKVISQKKLQTACYRGHPYTEETVRLEVDKLGRVHRRCKTCQALTDKRKYGQLPPSPLASLLADSNNPLDRLEEIE